ncbi:phosphoribosylamine--glycine ligase [Oscillospiraceae bacterium PP1C4]
MNILVVGAGGREHAIIRKLKENQQIDKIYCAPGNGGISADAECVAIKATDVDSMVAFAKKYAIDLAVVTPDDPLVLGMVDAMNAAGIKTFGPSKAAAQIEGSKVFSKDLMKKYHIPTAQYCTFDNPHEAIAYVIHKKEFPIVIKADGLALGKGVIIAGQISEAVEAIHSIMEDKVFGMSGNQIVIEEFLTGPEVSVLAFCDGETIIPMVSAMDHKRALDGDEGLNTGGMGAVAPNSHYTESVAKVCMEKIYKPTVQAMKAEGRPFSGCLFFGLMLTQKGPYVIEYNCRFGDPETQVVLPLLESDLLDIMLAIWDKRLDQTQVKFSNRHAACVVMASGGYPVSYETGYLIEGLEETGQLDDPCAVIYHAGTKRENGAYKTAGGRVLGVACIADTSKCAIKCAYNALKKIVFKDAHYRRDIGTKN